MTKQLRIYRPNAEPFGALSNNYYSPMEVDGQRWNTVSSYIYTQYLHTFLFKNIVKNTPASQVKRKFEEYYTREIHDQMKKALQSAYTAKFEQDDKLADMLLATGSKTLMYDSKNDLLGANGLNLVGNQLMQTRTYIRRQRRLRLYGLNKEENFQKIYDAFLVQTALDIARRQNMDTKQFAYFTNSEIVDTVGRKRVEIQGIARNVVERIVEKDEVPEHIMNAKDTTGMLYKEYQMKALNAEIRELERTDTIVPVNVFADLIIATYYPNLSHEYYEEAREQHFKENPQELLDISVKLRDLENRNRLPDVLSSKIQKETTYRKKRLAQLRDEAKQLQDVKYNRTDQAYNILEDVDPDTSVMFIPEGEQSLFSVTAFTKLFTVESRIYPTVSHYMLAYSLKQLWRIPTLDNAYRFILADTVEQRPAVITDFKSPADIQIIYERERSVDFYEQFDRSSAIALKAKFATNRELQDILLMTGNRTLVWNDRSDMILGIGEKNNGENLVGQHLMRIRENLLSERLERGEYAPRSPPPPQTKQPEKKKATVKDGKVDISSDLPTTYDMELQEWISMKTHDMLQCVTVATQMVEQPLTVSNVNNVLSKVYFPCKSAFGFFKFIKDLDVPRFYIDMMRDSMGITDKELIQVFWKRIATLLVKLDQMKFHLQLKDMYDVITFSQQYAQQTNKVCRPIVRDAYDNCIVNALLNIMEALHTYAPSVPVDTELLKTSYMILVPQVPWADRDRDVRDADYIDQSYDRMEDNEDDMDEDGSDFEVGSEPEFEGEEYAIYDTEKPALENHISNMQGVLPEDIGRIVARLRTYVQDVKTNTTMPQDVIRSRVYNYGGGSSMF